jgi:hypothetical protein
MNPPPLSKIPPPLPPYTSEQKTLMSAFKAAGAVVAALIVFGMLSNPSSDNAKPASVVSDAAPAVEQPVSPCSAITKWKGKPLSSNPSPSEARAWKAELDAKMDNPLWVKCMTDKYGALLGPAQ